MAFRSAEKYVGFDDYKFQTTDINKKNKRKNMKLIILFGIKREDDTIEEVVVPVNYESKEKLKADFEDILRNAFANQEYHFEFHNKKFDTTDFLFYNNLTGELIEDLPDYFELNEWVESFKLND